MAFYLVVAQVAAAVFAGVFLALNQGMVYTDVLSSNTTVNALLIVILGGTGTLFGSAPGALLVVAVGGILANYFSSWPLFLGALYIVFVLLYPQGLVKVDYRRIPIGLEFLYTKWRNRSSGNGTLHSRRRRGRDHERQEHRRTSRRTDRRGLQKHHPGGYCRFRRCFG